MHNKGRQERGVVLIMVLGTIFVVMLLANIIVGIMSSQLRITRHQISRTQAYYAALAGMNYAMDQMRRGAWAAGTNCPPLPGVPCTWSFDVADFEPASITGNSVSIVLYQPQNSDGSRPCFLPPGNSDCISVTADFAYTP